MKFSKQSVILVTGASQGIGYAVAEGFAKAGYRVIGVARNLPKTKPMFDAQIMDVTQAQSIQTVLTYIKSTYKQLDVLINNAGYGIAGAVEETPVEEVKRLFDVNVMGLHQVTQTMLPLLKVTKGLIINIGSVAGDFTIPFQTFYSMTKSSVATYTEGLRQELKPFGIRVVNVKPGDTKSNFSNQRQRLTKPTSPYRTRFERSLAVMEKDEKGGLPASSVYKVCLRLVTQKNPPIHVTVGLQYKILQFLKWLLPTKLVQWLLYQVYGK
jgi:short-subunit dehydrogenase